MIENKAFLEKQGSKSFNWKIFKGVSKQFLRNLYSWQVILGSILCFLIFNKMYSYFHIESFMGSFFPTFLVVIVMFIPVVIFGKKKFSFIGNFAALVTCFFALNYYTIPHIAEPSIFYYINLGVMTIFFVCSLKTMISLVVFYKKRFQTL